MGIAKPLEWLPVDEDWWAAETAVNLSYEVRQARASVRVRFPDERRFVAVDGNLEAAKAAAQADYERRIRASLSPSALASIEMREEMVKALRPFADLPMPERDGFTLYTRAQIEAARALLTRIGEGT